MNQEDRILSLLTQISGDVAGLKADVAELKADVSVLKADVSVLKQDVSGLKDAVQATNQRLDQTNQRLELVEVAQKAASDRLSRLETKVETSHEELTGQISNLDHRTARIAVDLRNLRKDTDALRKEMKDGFDGVYKCLDITDAQVNQLTQKIAQ